MEMEAESTSSAKLRYEKELYRFLKARIQKMGGTIEFQHITGHLSQLRLEVRTALGTSKVDILNFINKHSDTFSLKDNIVSVINYKAVKMKDYDSDGSSVDIEASLPKLIMNGKGVVVKLLPSFGFIKSQQPVKTSVYFRVENFGFHKDVNLTDCGINIGTMVNFHAVRETNDNFTSKYRAKKVWKSDKNSEENNVVHNPRKNRETGLYDPINLDGEGVIQNVFSSHGFILANGDKNNTVFFHKHRVVNYDNIVDLTKVFENGDLVEFSAHRTTKENTKARWEATKVWKKSKKNPSTSKHKNVPFKSSSSIISSITSKSSSSVVSSSKSLVLPGFYSSSAPKQVDVKQKHPTREMIYNITGKICPRSNGVVIKFGENLKELADGDSSVYYISGTEVKEISWEFTEGDDVKFDAVKIKSFPGWKALLVWMGNKPDVVLSPSLSNFSEFTDEELDEIEDEEVDETPDEIGDPQDEEVVETPHDDADEGAGEIVDGIPDDTESSASGHLSLSSHSSLKSSSMFSDTSDFKTNKSPKGSSRTADSAANTENRNASNKGFKVRNLCNSPLHSSSDSSSSSSQESLSSSSSSHQSKESKTSHQSKELSIENTNKSRHGFLEEKSVASFSDIPKTVKASKSVSASKCDNITDISDIKSKIVSKKSDSINQKNSDDISENDISVCPKNPEIKDISKDVEVIADLKETEMENSGSITKHENMIGKISKVYSTFAEAKSPEFQNPIAFSWNIFYSNKNSMDSLDLNDLREVLKVGETVHFNNFEIVDDNGQTWQKVSLAWSGCKPLRVHEMSPEEFIQQNNLSVTVKNLQLPKPAEKFLVGYDIITPNTKDVMDVSQTESCSEDDEKTFHSPVSFIESEIFNEPPSTDFKLLSNMINQKLMINRDILMDSKVDLNSLSAEIVSMVLDQYNIREPNQCLLPDFSSETTGVSCSCKKIGTISSRNINIKNIEVQTICTGEIMAQHIFTEG